MIDTEIIGLILIIINVIVSYKGFKSDLFFDKYKFDVGKILVNKDFKRLITSSFLHGSWLHLILNMVSLYFFSSLIESYLGKTIFLLIYFGSMIGGDLLSLLVHRNKSNYSAIGASGAIAGVVFASIVLFPKNYMGFFTMPLFIPNWLYGILYVVWTIYGITYRKDNIAHEAHLGGAVIGMCITVIYKPSAFLYNYVVISTILVMVLSLLYIVIKKPHLLLLENMFSSSKKNYTIDDKFNEEKVEKQKYIDSILEKISAKGIDSLTNKERRTLEEYSKNIR